MTARHHAWLALLAVVLLAACRPADPAPLHPVPSAQLEACRPERPCGDTVSLTYLGVSGFVVRHGAHALLTAPSFSHPRMSRVVFGLSVRPDTQLADSLMGVLAARGERLEGVDGVLVGHAHYDHLLDVPYLLRRWLPPHVKAYGSPTMQRMLRGDTTLRGRAVAVDSAVGTAATPGKWIYLAGGRLRAMPLESSHAPNFLWFTLAPWRAGHDFERLPRTGWTWRMGEPYAWLIDVVRPDSVPVFRIFYQDAASRPEHAGLPPMLPRDVHPVDVAILCVGNYGGVDDYPGSVLRALAPRHVILGHWEDFFRSPRDSLAVVPRTNVAELVRRLEAEVPGRWTTPAPMATVRVAF